MAEREELNVSLPSAQGQFVQRQVASGRYQSVSEVVGEGLRLLERVEQQRLLEKWLLEGELTAEEEASLPPGLLEQAQRKLNALIQEGVDDARAGRLFDGPAAMERLKKELEVRRLRESA